MTTEHHGTVWPKPRTASLWDSLTFLVTRSRAARHYLLSREIGVRRKFIGRLRDLRERHGTEDPRYLVINEMLMEERKDLLKIIARREALWQKT